MPHQLIYAPSTKEHLGSLTARERSMLFDGVDRQLTHEPTKVTRQRAPLRDELGNPTTYWKLRIGALRVYYYVESKPKASVNIVAIGRKEGEQVRIGSQLIKMDELISWLNQEG